MDIRQEINAAMLSAVADISPLSGGCVGEVYRVRLQNGTRLVAKVDGGLDPVLHIEGEMLRFLAEQSMLPVPVVLHSQPRLLLLEYLVGESYFSPVAQQHAAELLAALHNLTAPTYGLAWDTLIGGLHQPNAPAVSWLAFFAEHRLQYMAGV